MYKMTYVKQVCETIYGRDIPERTWGRWKCKLGLPKNIRYCSGDQMEQLLSLANLRRQKPLSQLNLKSVLNSKSEALNNLRQEIDLQVIPESCEGKNLPALIVQVTGRNTSIKTLYRWAKRYKLEFHLNQIYKKDEINKWVSIANKI